MRKSVKKQSTKRKPKKKISKRKTRRNPSMTYGILPSYDMYSEAFDKVVDGFYYKIRNDKRVGNVNLTKRELWMLLSEAVADWNDGDEDAGDWASVVLSTLGFEWI